MLFSWREVEQLGDLERLAVALSYLPDEALMQILENGRGKGRDDYPVRPMWNSMVGGVVFQHETIESLRRELRRNAQLREMCGFDPLRGVEAVPPPWAYTRFLRNVMANSAAIGKMFDGLVRELEALLPDLGRELAMDGKAISSYANGKRGEPAGKEEPGRRRDEDAEWGVHAHKGEREDGSVWQKVKKWFGYTLHLVVDSRYELPVGFELTKANASEVKEGHRLLDKMQNTHPQLLKRCERLSADRGYDDTKLIKKLWDEHEITPLVDIRNCWKDGEETKLVEGCQNVVYDYEGKVYCVCLATGE